ATCAAFPAGESVGCRLRDRLPGNRVGAAPGTGSQRHRHRSLKQPMIEKLVAMRLLRNGRGVAGPGARSVHPRTELPGEIRALGGSTMELAGEPGTRSTPEECQAAHAKRLR